MLQLFQFSLRLKGFPLKEATAEFQKIQAVADADFEKYIVTKKMAIVDYHTENNQLYQELLAKKTITHWDDLPIMTKTTFLK